MKGTLVESIFNKYAPIDTNGVVDAFNSRMLELGFEDVTCVSCDYDEECNIFVSFQDTDGNQLDVVFCVDPDEGVIGIVGEEEDDFITIIDLDALMPTIEDTMYGYFVNLTDLSWMNTSGLEAIFSSGDIEFETEEQDDVSIVADPFNPTMYESITEARKVAVIRGGKKVKLAVVRKKRRKLMTGHQKSAMKAAARKRKMQKSKINRKRKRSLALRKRLSLKTPKLSRFQKVAGTANRKR